MIFALSVLFYVPRKRECGTLVLKEGFFVRYVPSEELEKECECRGTRTGFCWSLVFVSGWTKLSGKTQMAVCLLAF